VVHVAGGPESLVIDAGRDRAYTHLWKAATVAIDLHAHSVAGQWKNGCEGSRGIAVDEVRPVGEVVLEGERGARTGASVLAGGIWRVTQELAVDAAVRLAREAAGHVTEIRLGLTWAFAVGLPR
jgi:hypothetical protein